MGADFMHVGGKKCSHRCLFYSLIARKERPVNITEVALSSTPSMSY